MYVILGRNAEYLYPLSFVEKCLICRDNGAKVFSTYRKERGLVVCFSGDDKAKSAIETAVNDGYTIHPVWDDAILQPVKI